MSMCVSTAQARTFWGFHDPPLCRSQWLSPPILSSPLMTHFLCLDALFPGHCTPSGKSLQHDCAVAIPGIHSHALNMLVEKSGQASSLPSFHHQQPRSKIHATFAACTVHCRTLHSTAPWSQPRCSTSQPVPGHCPLLCQVLHAVRTEWNRIHHIFRLHSMHLAHQKHCCGLGSTGSMVKCCHCDLRDVTLQGFGWSSISLCLGDCICVLLCALICMLLSARICVLSWYCVRFPILPTTLFRVSCRDNVFF